MTLSGSSDLLHGNILRSLFLFSLPLMIGNLLQQFYNIADTFIVGRFLGDTALAAVGGAYTVMVFLNSVIIGLAMGIGSWLSIQYGADHRERFRKGNAAGFEVTMLVSLLLTVLVYAIGSPLLHFLSVPEEVLPEISSYLSIIYSGLFAVFLYNYCANVLRAVGNSRVPLYFLAVSAVLNIVLDLYFVVSLHWGIAGAAGATVFSQYVSGFGILIYIVRKEPDLLIHKEDLKPQGKLVKEILHFSLTTSLQQSVMNFGILLVQGLVNSFGTVIMAAFAAAVKIDTFAYSPVQDFGNAYSVFAAQNYGAGQTERIHKGTRISALFVLFFSLAVSAVVFFFGADLMGIFTNDPQIIAEGAWYLKAEGSFYCLIGFLFMFYGYYRAVGMPAVSLVLTVISLGTRVVLSYLLSTFMGVTGIWISIPIGWVLADLAGLVYLKKKRIRTGK
jgi:putative MATE family efflux protein